MDERDYKAMNAEIKNQTAVELLVEEINKLTGLSISMDEPCVEQALKMEKKQLCYFYVKGAEAEINNPYVTNIEFYKETYKK
jgi:hypothetical protein